MPKNVLQDVLTNGDTGKPFFSDRDGSEALMSFCSCSACKTVQERVYKPTYRELEDTLDRVRTLRDQWKAQGCGFISRALSKALGE